MKTKLLMQELGNRIKNLRLMYNYSESMLSEYLDISVDTLKGIENGVVAINTVQLSKLCDLYDCPYQYLIEGGDYEKQEIMNHSGVTDLKAIAKMNQVKNNLIFLRKLEQKKKGGI